MKGRGRETGSTEPSFCRAKKKKKIDGRGRFVRFIATFCRLAIPEEASSAVNLSEASERDRPTRESKRRRARERDWCVAKDGGVESDWSTSVKRQEKAAAPVAPWRFPASARSKGTKEMPELTLSSSSSSNDSKGSTMLLMQERARVARESAFFRVFFFCLFTFPRRHSRSQPRALQTLHCRRRQRSGQPARARHAPSEQTPGPLAPASCRAAGS